MTALWIIAYAVLVLPHGLVGLDEARKGYWKGASACAVMLAAATVLAIGALWGRS